MRVAFYAPMKPPNHPVPSGDRAMARQLIAAIERAGHQVEVASVFSSYCGDGDRERQRRLSTIGKGLAARLIHRYQARSSAPPQAWFTYHVYHKAPDWLGPAVSRRLGIPYVIAEASHAPKQAGGPWKFGMRAAAKAIRSADGIFGLNSADTECLRPLINKPEKVIPLKPFIDCRPYAEAARHRSSHRSALCANLGLAADVPLLMTVAMMRPGDKLRSYRNLAASLGDLLTQPWQLLVAGDGVAQESVRAMFAPFQDRVRWLGRLDDDALARALASADIFVWPAVGEAYGMALLEAQAAGLPVVAGNEGGVGDVVLHGATGLLTPPRDVRRFTEAISELLADQDRRRRFAARTRDWIAAERDIVVAAMAIDRELRRVVREASSGRNAPCDVSHAGDQR